MPGLTFPENVRVTTATTGTGTLTLGSAVASYAGSSALVNGKSYPYTLLDINGTDWETGVGVYASSGTTLTRVPFASTNAGAAINLSATGSTLLIGQSGRQAQSSYAAVRPHCVGEMQYVSGTTIGYSAGAAFIESEDRVIDFAAPANITPTLAASTMYNLYLFLSSGTPTIEAVTTAPTPFASPIGNAQSKTGNNTRRYLGSFFTGAGSTILPFTHLDWGGGRGEVRYTSWANVAPYLFLSAGAATTFTSQSLATIVPPASSEVKMRKAFLYTTSGGSFSAQFSLDGTSISWEYQESIATSLAFIETSWVAIATIAGVPTLYYKVAAGGGVGPNLYLSAIHYRFRR